MKQQTKKDNLMNMINKLEEYCIEHNWSMDVESFAGKKSLIVQSGDMVGKIKFEIGTNIYKLIKQMKEVDYSLYGSSEAQGVFPFAKNDDLL